MAIAGSSLTPSPAIFVKGALGKLIRWYLENERLLHPFELAAIFNHRFLQIHPFADGNGRVARELFNFILMRNGFPPVITPVSKKEEYMSSLEEADRGDIAFFIEFLALRMIDDYSRVLCSVLELSRDDERDPNPEERKELLDLSAWFLGLTSEFTREVPARAKGAIEEILAGWSTDSA